MLTWTYFKLAYEVICESPARKFVNVGGQWERAPGGFGC
jgi:hypothetical protein